MYTQGSAPSEAFRGLLLQLFNPAHTPLPSASLHSPNSHNRKRIDCRALSVEPHLLRASRSNEGFLVRWMKSQLCRNRRKARLGISNSRLRARATRSAAISMSTMSDDVAHVYDQLMTASDLLDANGDVILTPQDIAVALADMHMQPSIHVPSGAVHPRTYLPASLYAGEDVNVTNMVRSSLPNVLSAHPIFLFMVVQVLGNDDFSKSVYFGTEPRDTTSLDFSALCRRFVTSMYIFEVLLALDRDTHRQLVLWYESLYTSTRRVSRVRRSPRSIRDALLGFFLNVKGESVLASINTFEKLRRLSKDEKSSKQKISKLSTLLNAIMKLNIFEAVLSNLSFAFWPDNARAGMALLLAPLGEFDAELKQQLDKDWMDLYLAWNANFIWPSHYFPDMMCFSMLATPTISLGDPSTFQYNRAHSLFWVVRSNQLTRLLRQESSPQVPCFHCRQLEPASDRQPLTSRVAVLTRARGEELAASMGEDVSAGSGIWWRLFTEIFPQQVGSGFEIYQQMPKVYRGKLKQL